MIKMKLRG